MTTDPERLLLDTHVLVWWLLDDRSLPRRHERALEEAEEEGWNLHVSAITLWEIALLADRGRVRLPVAVDPFLARLESRLGLEILPLTARIAVEGQRLGPTFPRDQADRIIAATARCHGLTLLTADEAIVKSRAVATR